VEFYESGKVKKICIMKKGTVCGESIEWYESGSIKSREFCKYGIVTSYEGWDEDGNLIDKKRA
jgi:antitoxin component YwqK of YwqJK toxin-antitoxin module